MKYLEPVGKRFLCVSHTFLCSPPAGSISIEEGKMKHIVFLTTNVINDMIYIGVHTVKDENKDDGYRGSGNYISSAIKKYSKESFHRETLFTYKTRQEALDKEAEIVTSEFVAREDTYNLRTGGLGGCAHSEETKRKMSFSKIGPKNFNYNKKFSEETKEKLRVSHMGIACGELSVWYGRKHTEESKEKNRKKHLGKKHTKETIQKMRQTKLGKKNPMFGRKHVVETRQKISRNNGNKLSLRTVEQRRKDILEEPQIRGWKTKLAKKWNKDLSTLNKFIKNYAKDLV